jgi:Family of unknown function (DUF6194)
MKPAARNSKHEIESMKFETSNSQQVTPKSNSEKQPGQATLNMTNDFPSQDPRTGNGTPLSPAEIVADICERLDGVMPKASWGETSMFYNPGKALPNGVYFCTIKEHNGDNDKSSNLDRDGVFRVAIGLAPQSYKDLFGARPPRPAKGGVVETSDDFTAVDLLMPHPIYAWMGWAQILSPTDKTYKRTFHLISEAHQIAVVKFNKKVPTR